MGWRIPEHFTYAEYEQQVRDDLDTEDYCEQCDRVRTETCVACGDESELHAA
jgi:hypothetical protein